MKRFISILLLLCCMLPSTSASASMLLEYDGGIHNYTGSVYTLSVNGKTLTDLPLEPIIFNDRALVPLREVFEALGAEVNYNDSDKSVTVEYDSIPVKLQIGSATAIVDGIRETIPDGVAPKLIAKWGESAKTMVPVRFISESVGLDVDFDSKKGHISISDGNAEATPSPSPQPSTTPAPSVTITDISYEEKDGVVTVTVSANKAISAFTKPAVTTSNVLYIDISGANFKTANKIEVNTGAVIAVRVGLHDNLTRVAVDTEGMKKYSVSASADKKKIIMQIADSEDAEFTAVATPAPTQNPSASPTPSPTPVPVNSQKYVVIDAGHGGSDPGTHGSLMTEEELSAYYAALETTEPILATMAPGSGKTYYEKDIALSVSKKVQKLLEAEGVNVIMTRSKDTYPALDERPALANSKGAALFFSIHLNSTTTAVTAASGIEIFYSEKNNSDFYGTSSKEMAEEILDCVLDETGAKSRGVKTGNLLVNRECVMPSTLIEIGFMNNPDELSEMITETYQDKLAKGIARGILKIHESIELP